MKDLRQQNRGGSHKAHVNSHPFTSHLQLSLMREPKPFYIQRAHLNLFNVASHH